jgi:two-component system LytT family response regulator
MLNVILVDDESLARQAMRELLEAQAGVQIVGEASSIKSAQQLISDVKPDAVFLDIKMPGKTGFDFLQLIEERPKVVFVTAYSQYAVQAFEVDAVDYLLKPVRPERLADAVQRLREACGRAASPSLAIPPYQPEDRLCFRTPGRTLVAVMAEVGALEADGDFTRIYVASQPPLMICQTLGAYEHSLPSPPFLRVDRSLMLNIHRISKIEHLSRDETLVTLAGISRTFSAGRKAWTTLREAGVTG